MTTDTRPRSIIAHQIRYDSIMPDPEQPRKAFDTEGLEQLAQSIAEHGLLQPISIRPLPVPSTEGKRYVIIAGERRWRATGVLGWTHIPSIIKGGISDAEATKLQLLENIVRRDLNPVEEARALKRLLDDGYTPQELGRTLGMATSQISWRVQMLEAREDVLHLVARGQMKPAVAFEIAKLELDGQAKVLRALSQDNLTYNEVVAVCGHVRAEEQQIEMFTETKVSEEQRQVAHTFTQAFEQVASTLSRLERMEQETPGSLAKALEAEASTVEVQIDEAIKGLYRVKKAMMVHRVGRLAEVAS